jgi:hypothetical protein
MGMNPEFKARWVEALRSGDYKQTQQTLYDGTGYCCLGVACDLLVKDGVIKTDYYTCENENCCDEWYFGDESEYSSKLLPEKAIEVMEIGMDNPIVDFDGFEHHLAELNDKLGLTFSEIADLIEDQL